MTDVKRRNFAARQLAGALMLAALITMIPGVAGAMEIIPSLGVTKSTDDNAGDAQGYAGLALRAPLLPFLKVEGGIGYRQDSFSQGDLKVRQWPLTASVWAAPLPMLYAGGGIGWYRTTLDFEESLPQSDFTEMKTGLHLGGGLAVPVAPHLSLDLNGRYIFMQGSNDNIQVPTTFNPDFWTTSLGLAIQF
jgi:opacity protein-like surface antigen